MILIVTTAWFKQAPQPAEVVLMAQVMLQTFSFKYIPDAILT